MMADRREGDGNDGGDNGTGTGLANVRQRLALLYPGRHHLHAAPAAAEFQTDLTIDL